ncbi:MAG: hypothetical protein H8E15_12490 [Planctomycetes bacterium]|nr:hypothetical protein [Planctomycetota bacterium]
MTGHHDNLWSGLTQDSQGRLYGSTGSWVSGFSIYEIDPVTGLGTFIADTGLFGVGCIAIGPNDTFYLINDPLFPAIGGLNDLYTFDTSTGLLNLVGNTGIESVIALDFHGDQLCGMNGLEGLVWIDTVTGVATDVNPNFIEPEGATISMCFDDAGAGYYVNHALWMIDFESGIYSPVDWISSFGYWAEAVFREGPKPHFSLWLNGTTGHYMQAKMTGITPNGQAAVLWAKGEGGPTLIPSGLPCAGTMMDLNSSMQKLSIVTADANGEAVLGPGPKRVPSSAKGFIWLQAVDLTTCETSNRVLFFI